MIGIIGAMKIEIEQIRAKTENPESVTISGVEYVAGTLNGKKIVTAVCGIGKVAAAMCAQTMILRFAPELIINTGVGGTLTDRLGVGDVAIACDVVQHDMDTTAIGDAPGFISGISVVKMPCDRGTVEVLQKCAAELSISSVVGTIASGDQFISSPSQKARIVSLFDAVACEMEGAAIGQVCFTNSVPFAVVRAISDCADGSAPVSYTEFLPAAASNAAKMIEFTVNHS